MEDHKLDEEHPKYGIVEYEKILHQLKDSSNIVIFEKKTEYRSCSICFKNKKQIDRLIKKGSELKILQW
jgi:hypothetical protein